MARFRIYTPGVKSLLRSPGTRQWADNAASEVASEARRIAPVRTGHYKRSIAHTVVFEDSRWIGRVRATDFKAHWVEFGTHGIRKSRVLGSALDVVQSSARITMSRRSA